jgi:hypothetical protein
MKEPHTPFQEYVHKCAQDIVRNTIGSYLVKFKKNSKGQRVGAVVAYKAKDNKVYVGSSLRHKKDAKKPFDRCVAVWKAMENAWEITNLSASKNLAERDLFSHRLEYVPSSLRADMKCIIKRAYRYYKDAFQPKPENTEGLVELSTRDISSFAMNKAQP